MTTTTATRTFAHPLHRFGVLARALEQALPGEVGGPQPVWVPALDIAERTDAYLITADLPGVREEELELTFENNVLTVRGAKAPSFALEQTGERDDRRDGGLRVHVAERQSGAFERSVRLPEYVEGDRIEAQLVNGVLTVLVPKSPAAQPRRIPVGVRALAVDGPTGRAEENGHSA